MAGADHAAGTFGGPPLVVTAGRLVDPATGHDGPASLLIREGVVEAVHRGVDEPGAPAEAALLDARRLVVMPGLIDARVHVGEPGAEHRETIASARRAAAAGGVTGFVMMPETSPPIDDVALVDFVRRAAPERDDVHVWPSAAVTKGLRGEELTEFGLLAEAGAVMLTEGRRTLASNLVLRRAMTYARDFGLVLALETSDPDLAAGGVMNEGFAATLLGLPGIPREAEIIPLERDLRLAALTGARYHAAKLSTAIAAGLMARAKADGLAVTAGVSINHLSLNENDVGRYRTFFRLQPPLRAEDDRQAMIEALADGTIDLIVSDHDPQDVDTKRLPFAEAESGAIGLETLLAAALRLHHDGRVPLMRLVECLSTAPARLLGLPGGRLAPGAPADLILVDPDRPWVFTEDAVASRSRNTCFEGARLTGKVLQTLVAGRTVFEDRGEESGT